MMCDLPRHVQLSRERIHLVSLICLADLFVGQRSVHSMFDLFSFIQWFLWWPCSLVSFICDFLTAELCQMSTAGFCSHGLEGCCSELSTSFSVAGCYRCGRVSRRTEHLRHWIQSPAAGIPLVLALCRAAEWLTCVTGNRLVLLGDSAAKTAIDREMQEGLIHLPAIYKCPCRVLDRNSCLYSKARRWSLSCVLILIREHYLGLYIYKDMCFIILVLSMVTWRERWDVCRLPGID